ncbi:ABC transporter ATP-binding protein [Desulfobacterales bacterium HSG16]|nr:ABC transporter ATP-binding protein [Desulfobacterales bacterium HSG16]
MAFNVEKICFSYDRCQVIADISLNLSPGHFYGIIGPNGSGKSTLIDLIMGHKRPEKGSIHYKGKNLARYSKKQLAQEIALVPQNFQTSFPFQTKDIVLMGRYPYISRFSTPSNYDMDVLDKVLEQTDTLQFKNRYLSQLSGGEVQRVIFARALAQETPVLMLDEATSNLDIKHTLQLMNLVKGHVNAEKKTVFAVIQDINLAAMFCDQMIIMKKGRISSSGPTLDVLTEKTIKDVFSVKSHVSHDAFSQTARVSFRTF